jgi:hypothetical protein
MNCRVGILYDDQVHNEAMSRLRGNTGTAHIWGPYRLLFQNENLSGSAGFRQLWPIDFPLDRVLSPRRTVASRSKTTWHQRIYVLFVIDRDIVLSQKMKKCAPGVGRSCLDL